jgi:hypothetical protein
MAASGRQRTQLPRNLTSAPPLKADSRRTLRHVRKGPATEVAASVNYVVGASKQRGCDCQTERFGGLEVDDQLELRWQLHG